MNRVTSAGVGTEGSDLAIYLASDCLLPTPGSPLALRIHVSTHVVGERRITLRSGSEMNRYN